jgi:hypothetical protein
LLDRSFKNSTVKSFSDILPVMKFLFSQQNTQEIISSLLVVWLSGFVFLFCCGTTEIEAKDNFCPLSKAKKHCDKSETGSSSDSLRQASNEDFDCCGFLPAVFDKARKIEKNPATANLSGEIKIESVKFSSVKIENAVAEIYQPPIFYKEKTFIKNCVLLI